MQIKKYINAVLTLSAFKKNIWKATIDLLLLP